MSTADAALAPGIEVELKDVFLTASPATARAYRAQGKWPSGLVNGTDCFGVNIGEKARVVRQEGDVVQVRVLGGSWQGREGWVSRESVRVPPTEDESSADVVDGRSLWTRREIYAAYHAAGMIACGQADSRYPFNRLPTDPEATWKYLAERAEVYEAAKEQGRRDLLERYQLDREQLDRIEAEGMEKKWPLWDGLADERGSIPAFGPARTDEQGRIVMSDSEWEARRAAVTRTLGAVGALTDETDNDEVWARVFRGLEGAR